MTEWIFNATGTGNTGTVQRFIVPATGNYTIHAYGARGSLGNTYGRSEPFPMPGDGAYLRSDFNLSAGDVLNIVVGQAGTTIPALAETADATSGGGGGYSAVFLDTLTGEFTKNSVAFTCLIMAAGGSGTGDYGYSTLHAGVFPGGLAADPYTPTNYTSPNTATTTASAMLMNGGSVAQYIAGAACGGTYTRAGQTSYGGFGAGGSNDDNGSAGGGWNYVNVSIDGVSRSAAVSWTRGSNAYGEDSGNKKQHGLVLIEYTAPTLYDVEYEWPVDLIVNRTQTDVNRVLYLHGLKWRNMNVSERAEWLGILKGIYNFSDLNRVESAVGYIANILKKSNHISHLQAIINWNRNDVPTEADFQRYLSNVKVICNAVSVPKLIPELPDDMNMLTYNEANSIERILLNIHEYLFWMIDSFRFSNQLYSDQPFHDLAGWDNA